MAIAFARCEYKSRSTGGNAVRSAAYNCRSPMVDERTGERFDFRRHRKSGDIHLGVRVPEGAPAEFCNPVHLWNAAEVAEKRKDAQVAREIVLALPKEGSAEDWVALLERFASKHFVAKGVAVQLDIHEPDEETANPHAHILITTRRLTPAGFETVKARDLDPEVISTKRGGRQVDGERWGEIWRAEQDEYFREQGLELRVDPTQAKPEKHLGPKRFRAPEDCGPKQDAAETEVENAAAWRDPGQVLEIMTRRSPTFRLGDLDRQLARRIADPEERAAVRGGVLGHRDLVEVYDPQSGARARRYTTRQVIAEENQARRDAAGLVADLRHAVRPAAVGAALGRRPTMREDQRSALHHAVGPEGLAIVQGRAGTGKSYTLSAVAEVYAASGCEVIGLGPTNAIGRELAADPHIQRGGTLHSELWFVENGKRRWNDKTVVLVDEAGMVDTKTMGRLMSAARSARAKVILVGDDRQLQSVARGGLFRELAAEHGAGEIVTVTRQREGWQRQAAEDLAGGRVREALTAFEQRGAIRWSGTQEESIQALVAQWAADSRKNPASTRFVLAYTNADVHALNGRLRAVRAERREIGADVALASEGELRPFAVQDRVQIVRTDKARGLFNGEAGTIERIVDGMLTVRLDHGKRVSWNSAEFDGYRHGYAGTVYKSQGRTIDQTYLLHSPHWRAESTYVALTRQRDSARVFVARDEAPDLEELIRQVSRSDDRRAASSYCPADEAALVQRARQAVESKIGDARAYAEVVVQGRPTGDRLSAYLQDRSRAGDIWAEIETAGGSQQPQQHPAYEAFRAAQERRHGAVLAVAGDAVAMASLRDSRVLSAQEFAADHLMATGTRTRAVAVLRAEGRAVELGLIEPPRQKVPQIEREQDRGYEHEM